METDKNCVCICIYVNSVLKRVHITPAMSSVALCLQSLASLCHRHALE